MIGLRILDDPRQCPYLPDRVERLENEFVLDLSAAEYAERMNEGFRRFGRVLFRPRCPSCTACQALRVDVARFSPNRSQKRCWKLNHDDLRCEITDPSFTPEIVDLSKRFHVHRSRQKGWGKHSNDASSHYYAFVDNPFQASEWRYYLGKEVVGVGYVDDVPDGLSAVYFFHDPRHAERSLGTYNVLRMINEAVSRGLPHVYLGYYVEGCESLEYKANFQPNEVLNEDGSWQSFRHRE
jgi:arginyl-tRNA--protein-N-Asp/Glu arginylyltransferase